MKSLKYCKNYHLWHKHKKWTKVVGKMASVDLLDVGLPQTFSLLKEKKKQCLCSTVKQGIPINLYNKILRERENTFI